MDVEILVTAFFGGAIITVLPCPSNGYFCEKGTTMEISLKSYYWPCWLNEESKMQDSACMYVHMCSGEDGL